MISSIRSEGRAGRLGYAALVLAATAFVLAIVGALAWCHEGAPIVACLFAAGVFMAVAVAALGDGAYRTGTRAAVAIMVGVMTAGIAWFLAVGAAVAAGCGG